MDFIAGCFHDGFLLYAQALSEALADGVSQNDGINITVRMQNRRIWGVFHATADSFYKCIQIHLRDKSIGNVTLCRFDVHINRTIIDYTFKPFTDEGSDGEYPVFSNSVKMKSFGSSS